jgi:Ca2+-binding RTX toxin-like protein
MNRRLTRIALAAALALTGTIGVASSAQASYHLNFIREVHEGPASTGDYVELQATAAGQNLVAGKHIVSYDAGGAVLTNFTIPTDVANGADQATILIANTPTVGGVTADFNAFLNLNVDNTGGTVCFTDSAITTPLDCVAFDGVGGATVTLPASVVAASQWSGPVFALPGAALDTMSLIRTTARDCATKLDAADDTNTAADFALGSGTPRNNSSAITETACATPGGGGAGSTPKPTCAGKTATIAGTNGSETLAGTPAADVIAGLGGKDVIKGLAGNDVICGGAGKDRLLGGAGNDKLLGEAGKDTLKGGAGKDKLKGGAGKDVQIQ